MELIKKLNNSKIIFLVILALSASVRFFNITKSSIWHDEGYTALMVKQNIFDITRTTAIDVHPPFFYYCLKLWTLIFGHSDLALRSMSAVFGIGTVVGVYLLAKKLFGEKVGLISMLFAALAPYLIRYSQEARMYGVEGFWTIMATYFLVCALEKRSDIKESFLRINKYWLLYAVAMLGGMYTHYYAFFLVFVHWIYILLKSIGSKERPILSKEWWGANILIGLVFLPWVPNVIKQVTKIQGNYWIPPVNLRTLPESIIGAFTYTVPDYTAYSYYSAFLILFGLTGYLMFMEKGKSKEVLMLTLSFLVPTGIVFLMSLKQPVYQTRYFVFAMPVLYILVALVISKVKYLYIKTVMIVAVAFVLANGTKTVYKTASHQMDDIAKIVNREFNEGDGLAATELYVYLDFDFYNKTGKRAKLIDTGEIKNNNEMAFIYPFKTDLVRKSFEDVETETGVVWVIGKTNPKSYEKIPENWSLELNEKLGYTEVRKYIKN